MTEELKRPQRTSLEPIAWKSLIEPQAKEFTKELNMSNAKILRDWREYSRDLKEQNTFLLDRIEYLENRLKVVNDNLFLETQQSAGYHAEIVELKRENQRLGAENLAIKTLLDEAKKTPPQVLPVIPQFVADDVENYREAHLPGDGIFDYASYTSPHTDTWLGDNENQVKFMLALMTGNYSVEKPKEKRYKVKIGTSWLLKAELHECGWDRTSERSATIFTKPELAEIADGAFYKIGLPENIKLYCPTSGYLEACGWEFDEEIQEWTNQSELIELVEVEE